MSETTPDVGPDPVNETVTETVDQPEAEVRPLRMCDVCGQVDDHPRHVFGYGPDDEVATSNEAAETAIAAAQDAGGDALSNVVAHVRDNSTQMRHMDCCRSTGCPDGSCNTVTAGAENARGADLVAHLTAQNTQEG